MIPYYGDGNPYLRLLSTAVEARGVQVSLGRLRGRVPLWSATRRTGRPDIVHLHWQHRFFVPSRGGWLASVTSTLAFFAHLASLKLRGTRVVWTVHNITNHEGERERWELAASRLLARVVDRMIVHCEAVRPSVAEAFGIPAERLAVCPHGTYGDWYRGFRSRAQARASLGLSADLKILLYFGLIRPYKGVEDLIRTFAGLPGEQLRLVVLGQPKFPDLGRTIQALAERDNRVETHLEFVEEARLSAYLVACDAVVLPYRDSLTSGAAVLAGASRRPVVMPRVGCIQEFPRGAGYFYDPEDDDGLRTAMWEACADRCDDRGEAAARYVSRFTWDAAAATVTEIYDGVLADRRTSAR